MKLITKNKLNKFIRLTLVALCIALMSIIFVSCGVDKSTRLIKIDYENMTIVGSSLKDFSKMFDEQDTLDPSCDIGGDAKTAQQTLDHNADGAIDDTDKSGFFDFTVDLFAPYNLHFQRRKDPIEGIKGKHVLIF